MHVGSMSVFKHHFYVYNAWNVHSSAGEAIGITNEPYCVTSYSNTMASMYS